MTGPSPLHGVRRVSALCGGVQFNPIPGYPIRRLYVEEIFDCGRHAVQAPLPHLHRDRAHPRHISAGAVGRWYSLQATHSQLIDPNLKFAVSDIPNGGFVHH